MIFMIGRNVLESKPVSVRDAFEIIEKRGKDNELIYEQQLAKEHAEGFAMDKAKYDKLSKALEGLGLLDSVTIIKLLDINPPHASTVRQIISREKKAFSDEEVAKIAAVFGLKEKGVA